jgi:tetratricopeptide (TPR) repeat protein
MKKIIFILAVIIANFTIEAQVKTPQPSPKSTLNQVVGLTDVVVEYNRPSAKGRVVFGDLVSFGKTWRTGANANSTVSFSDDVTIAGKQLKKGKYAIFTVPKADIWEVNFYSATDNWGTPENWDENKVAARVMVDPIMLGNHVETFTISINNLTNDSATLDIFWEKTMVSVKFEVPSQKMAMASIEKTLAGPTAGDYFSSAQYLLQSDGDLNKALEYINKAVGMTKSGADVPFWYLRQKSLIQAKLGDKKGAIETAQLSLAGATKEKNDDYVKMNNDSIKEWSKK